MTFNDFKKVLQSKRCWYIKDDTGLLLLPDSIISKTNCIDKAVEISDDGDDRLFVLLKVPRGYDPDHRLIKWDPIGKLVYWLADNGEQHLTTQEFHKGWISELREAKGTDEISNKLSANLYLHIKEFYDAYKGEDDE